MELAARVAEALLAGAEGAEVLSGLWHDIIEELEVDAAFTFCSSIHQLPIIKQSAWEMAYASRPCRRWLSCQWHRW